jgi:hypothetical protein
VPKCGLTPLLLWIFFWMLSHWVPAVSVLTFPPFQRDSKHQIPLQHYAFVGFLRTQQMTRPDLGQQLPLTTGEHNYGSLGVRGELQQIDDQAIQGAANQATLI